MRTSPAPRRRRTFVGAADHLVDGDGDDAAELLRVQEHQAPGHSVGELQGIVAQEALDDPPALHVIGGAARAAGRQRALEGAGEPPLRCPLQEFGHVVAGGSMVGQPVLEVGLAQLPKGRPAGGEPGEQSHRRADAELGVGGAHHAAGSGPSAQTSQHPPGRVGCTSRRSSGGPIWDSASSTQRSRRASPSCREARTPLATSIWRRNSAAPRRGWASSVSWLTDSVC